MEKHSLLMIPSPTNIPPADSNTNFYPAISTFAVQICYTNKCLLYSY